MHAVVNRVISKIKGESFTIDPEVPFSYLFLFFARKAFELIYGVLVFRRLTPVFVHHRATIRCKKKMRFGRNLVIDRHCYIDALSAEGIVAGNNVSIGRFTTMTCTGNLKTLGKGIKIGNNVGMGTRGHYGCAGGVTIGDNTIIGDYVSFHSENHNFESLDIPIRNQGVSHQGITVGENCWIGAKVTILDGAQVGNGCVIAAGAVVRGIIPDNAVIGGVPAKIIKIRS